MTEPQVGPNPRDKLDATEMGWLDADAILKYDAGRSAPAATPEIATAIRAIAEKPHLAPVILAGLMAE